MGLEHRVVEGEIPTSSMADVAFLLVIYFMLTVTLAATKGLDFALPPDDPAPVDPVESVLVEIAPAGALTVDGRPLELAALLPYLEPKLRQNPRKPVIVHPHPRASYGSAVTVLDELRRGQAALGLAEEIQIALPTRREAAELWQ